MGKKDPKYPQRVAILGQGFVGWGGGLDFLRLVLNAILEVQAGHREIYLFLPRSDWWIRVRRPLGASKRFILGLLICCLLSTIT